MKHKVSICLDKELLNKIEELAKDSAYRNKSHLVEIAIERFLKK